MLDKVRAELDRQGVQVSVVDGIEKPPLYGTERTEFLNRAKITLNLLPTWNSSALVFRLPMAAANRSMVVSETSRDHGPSLQNHIHYVGVPAQQVTSTILYYLEHENERERIVEAAHRLVTRNQTFRKSLIQLVGYAQSHEPFGASMPNGDSRLSPTPDNSAVPLKSS